MKQTQNKTQRDKERGSRIRANKKRNRNVENRIKKRRAIKEDKSDQVIQEQIMYEIKRLQKYGNDIGAEERLENILQDRITPSTTEPFFRKRPKLGLFGATTRIDTKLVSSTSFQAFTGEGFMYDSGKRNFEFLLLDWKPSLEAMVPILKIHEFNALDIKVSDNIFSF